MFHVTLNHVPDSHAGSPLHKYYSPDTGGFMKGGEPNQLIPNMMVVILLSYSTKRTWTFQ